MEVPMKDSTCDQGDEMYTIVYDSMQWCVTIVYDGVCYCMTVQSGF